MKERFFLMTNVALFATSIVSAKAKISVCLPCESIETIQELPRDSEIQKLVGQKSTCLISTRNTVF